MRQCMGSVNGVTIVSDLGMSSAMRQAIAWTNADLLWMWTVETNLREILQVKKIAVTSVSLQWRLNDSNGVSNHWRLDCLLKHLFRGRSKKTLKFRVTGLCEGNSPVTGEFPHKWPVTRKKFPFDDVIMHLHILFASWQSFCSVLNVLRGREKLIKMGLQAVSVQHKSLYQSYKIDYQSALFRIADSS